MSEQKKTVKKQKPTKTAKKQVKKEGNAGSKPEGKSSTKKTDEQQKVGTVAEQQKTGTVAEQQKGGLVSEGQNAGDISEDKNEMKSFDDAMTISEGDYEKPKEEKEKEPGPQFGSQDLIDLIMEMGLHYANKYLDKASSAIGGKIEKKAEKLVGKIDKLATPERAMEKKQKKEYKKDKRQKFWNDFKVEVLGKDPNLDKGIKAAEETDAFKKEVLPEVPNMKQAGANQAGNKTQEEQVINKNKTIDNQKDEVSQKNKRNKWRRNLLNRFRIGKKKDKLNVSSIKKNKSTSLGG